MPLCSHGWGQSRVARIFWQDSLVLDLVFLACIDFFRALKTTRWLKSLKSIFHLFHASFSIKFFFWSLNCQVRRPWACFLGVWQYFLSTARRFIKLSYFRFLYHVHVWQESLTLAALRAQLVFVDSKEKLVTQLPSLHLNLTFPFSCSILTGFRGVLWPCRNLSLDLCCRLLSFRAFAKSLINLAALFCYLLNDLLQLSLATDESFLINRKLALLSFIQNLFCALQCNYFVWVLGTLGNYW